MQARRASTRNTVDWWPVLWAAIPGYPHTQGSHNRGLVPAAEITAAAGEEEDEGQHRKTMDLAIVASLVVPYLLVVLIIEITTAAEEKKDTG